MTSHGLRKPETACQDAPGATRAPAVIAHLNRFECQALRVPRRGFARNASLKSRSLKSPLANLACAGRKCTSGQKIYIRRRCVFVSAVQLLESLLEKVLCYDQSASGQRIYAYVGGNPVNYRDSSGLRPGDSYPTIRDAGRQSIIDILPTSIAAGREYGGVIYSKPDGSYSYTEPVRGGPDSVAIPFSTSPSAAGWYHTHGSYDPAYNNEGFSRGDKDISDGRNIPGYLGTPSGAIREYFPTPGFPREGAVSDIARKSNGPCY